MRTMTITAVTAGLLVALSGMTAAGEPVESPDDGLSVFPLAPSMEESSPQTYRLEYDVFTRDIVGSMLNSVHVTGNYHRNPADGRMRWSGVEIAGSADDGARPAAGAPLGAMEGFEYGLGMEMVEEATFERFENEDLRHVVKTMVWDAAWIEAFALLRDTFKDLKPNQFVRIDEYQDFDVRMGEWGSLRMRDLQMKWTGISKMHGERCAVVFYQSFSNPVDGGAIRGRSCYWGQFWLSSVDGDIEYLTFNEDVILEMPVGPETTTVLNMQREARFEKTL